MAQARKRTEDEMIALLRTRYTESHGNGEAYAFMTHVRNAAGFNANRTIDAVAMSLWPSRGLQLHGFEIKCDRRDWLRELKDAAKAEALARYMDRWWLVAADDSIVQDGELPPTWGLLIAQGKRLVCKREAPVLEPEPVPRTFLACLLRSACRVAATTPEEIIEARDEERAFQKEQHAARIKMLEEALKEARDREHTFMRESGVNFYEWRGKEDPERVARLLKAALQGDRDLTHLANRVKRLAEAAQVLGEQATRILREHTEEQSDAA